MRKRDLFRDVTDEEVLRAIRSVPVHYARDENPPFERGATFYGISPVPAIDSANLGGVDLEGAEWVFEDITLTDTGAKGRRTGRPVRCKIVRNRSGIALLPRRLVTYQATAGNFGKRVDGYATTTTQRIAGVVDEWLPSAGVPDYDLFWMVVEGPSNVITDLANGVNNNIAIGDIIAALTAVTSQATTAGRARLFDITTLTATSTGTTDGTLGQDVFRAAANALGRALSSLTTNQTNTSLLVEIGRRW